MEARLALTTAILQAGISIKAKTNEGILALLPCEVIGGEFYAGGKVSMIQVAFEVEGERHERWVRPEHVFVDSPGGYDLDGIPGGWQGMDSIMFSPQLENVREMYDAERERLSGEGFFTCS